MSTTAQEKRIVFPWLHSLEQELERISEEDLKDSPISQSEGDEVVGVLPLHLRRIFTRMFELQASAMRAEADLMEYVGKKEGRERIVETMEELAAKSAILYELFWVMVKDEFKLWRRVGCTVSVKAKWTVVVRRENETLTQNPNLMIRFMNVS